MSKDNVEISIKCKVVVEFEIEEVGNKEMMIPHSEHESNMIESITEMFKEKGGADEVEILDIDLNVDIKDLI